ncbi:MAG TPA: hypothetical protein VLS90_10990 [Thermodesulfobacteriota bacterium]|nr:hypothetical protein [Thermodesulfobacteriota bacterium]
MAQFVRIKNYFFNLDGLAYVRAEKSYVEFVFSYSIQVQAGCGQNYIRLEKGVDLKDAEFEQVREFVLQLPDTDRIVVV